MCINVQQMLHAKPEDHTLHTFRVTETVLTKLLKLTFLLTYYIYLQHFYTNMRIALPYKPRFDSIMAAVWDKYIVLCIQAMKDL